MNPLHEAQHALQHYCSNVLVMLEQTLGDYCNATMKLEKEAVFLKLKTYSSRLALLEPFYCLDGDRKQANQLQKLCSLLGHESYQENDEEQVLLLTKIFQEIAQLPISTCG